eukprot:3420675-Rhodomonas_salina.2
MARRKQYSLSPSSNSVNPSTQIPHSAPSGTCSSRLGSDCVRSAVIREHWQGACGVATARGASDDDEEENCARRRGAGGRHETTKGGT